jgi:hypothetical protein
MITSRNRSFVTLTIARMTTAAEQFSAFSVASGFAASVGARDATKEMTAWADLKARELDGQFMELAKSLGYEVSKIVDSAEYRGYNIRREPGIGYAWSHKDIDLDDNRHGLSRTLAEAKADIDEQIEEMADAL